MLSRNKTKGNNKMLDPSPNGRFRMPTNPNVKLLTRFSRVSRLPNAVAAMVDGISRAKPRNIQMAVMRRHRPATLIIARQEIDTLHTQSDKAKWMKSRIT
jgi:hypothetical protein